MKCKIFKNNDVIKLEQSINDFLSNNSIEFVKIKYSSHEISDSLSIS